MDCDTTVLSVCVFYGLDVFGHEGESVQRCRLRGELWQEPMFPLVFKNHLQGEVMEECADTRWRSRKSFPLFYSVHITNLCF